ncbi:MAG TPA: ABC transporter ATP-binding protein [Candidatus Baltobacteraceae bacterium]|jgi:ABC-2 type transport system ATP-binding protein
MNPAPPVIAFDNLTKRYRNFEAVHDLTLHIEAGSICGLLGPNGAGKTTAMKTLLGFLRPTSGRVTINGAPVNPQTFESLSYVPETDALFGELTVAQHVELNRRSQPCHDQQRANELLGVFGLDRRKRVRKLSKGQKTALALVLALASRPRVLVLDEPSSGLDPVFQRVVLDLMIDAASDGGTVLFSSHQVGQVERAADHVAIMRGGRLLVYNDVDSLKGQEKIIEATFPGAIPDLNGAIAGEAVRRVERAGNMVRISVKRDDGEIPQRLAPYNPTSIRIVDRNLEDIFLDVVSEKS